MINLNIFKGELGFTTNINLVQTLAIDPNIKILFVGDPLGYETSISSFRMITATCLSPDYNTLAMDVDGDKATFLNMYYNQLTQSAASATFIASILTAMHQGKNILIFFPQGTEGLTYPKALAQFFVDNHGITGQWDNIPYVYNKAFDDRNASIMYYYGLITVGEYLAFSNPANWTQYYQRIAEDMNIPVDFNDNQSVSDFLDRITRYSQSMIGSNQITISPFTISTKR